MRRTRPWSSTRQRTVTPTRAWGKRRRATGEPYARVIAGGWISLASQIHYPTLCGGTWTFYPDPVGKIRILNPEMDQFYLPYAVYLLEEFLESTTDPHYGGEFVHGRPMKGHGSSPFANAELVRRMADHIAANAPAGASTAWYEAGSR